MNDKKKDKQKEENENHLYGWQEYLEDQRAKHLEETLIKISDI